MSFCSIHNGKNSIPRDAHSCDTGVFLRFFKFLFFLFLMGLFGVGCASPHMRHIDAGPLVTADRDVHGCSRVRVLGPLVETQQRDDGMRFLAVRPFYSKTTDPVEERDTADFLWPIGMRKVWRGEADWRFFPLFGHNKETADATSRNRWSVFPILFGGRGVDGDKYFAFFPFGGVLRNFIGRDVIRFVLFPLYGHSIQDDNNTYSVLWPIFSVTHGNDVYRWRIFPFYGISKNKNRWTKRFVLWPFWTSVKYEYPDQKGGGFILFPLFGRVRVGERFSWSVFPPFFKYQHGKNGHRALFCPWPFIRWKKGKVNQMYVWPLWGKKQISGDKKWFFLWPIVHNRNIERLTYRIHRFKIIPFVSYATKTAKSGKLDRDTRHADGEVFDRYFKLWPLLSYERRDDVLRFRVLALWPMRNQAGVERNLAPLWSLYTHERDGANTETELLWGLYRHRRSAEIRSLSLFPIYQSTSSPKTEQPRHKWSFFYGLVGYGREGKRKEIKLLYVIKLKWGDKPTP